VCFAKTALEEENSVEETVGAVLIARTSYESSQSAIVLWSVPVASEPGALNSILSRRHKFKKHSNSNLLVHIRGIIVGFGSLLFWGWWLVSTVTHLILLMNRRPDMCPRHLEEQALKGNWYRIQLMKLL
jgi:hypothetical protein